jgi:hypothetical protein
MGDGRFFQLVGRRRPNFQSVTDDPGSRRVMQAASLVMTGPCITGLQSSLPRLQLKISHLPDFKIYAANGPPNAKVSASAGRLASQ